MEQTIFIVVGLLNIASPLALGFIALCLLINKVERDLKNQ